MKYVLILAVITLAMAASSSCFDFSGFTPEKIEEPEIKPEKIFYSVVKSTLSAGKPGDCATPVEINAEESFHFIQEKDPVVIDVRTPAEYAAGRLEKAASNMDYYAPDFKEKLAKLDKKGKYLIYCRTGKRSGLALEIMKGLGFTDIHHIAGGIVAWQQAGYPVIKEGQKNKGAK